MSLIKPAVNYEGIEILASPEMLFDLVGWDGGNRKVHHVNFYVDKKHHVMAEKLNPIVNLQKYGLAKGFICIGTIGLARKHKIREGQITKIIRESKYSRTKHMREKLFELIDGINSVRQFPVAMQKVRETINKYGSNKYSLMLAAEIGETLNRNNTVVDVPKEIIKLCDSFTAKCLHKSFLFSSHANECRIQTRIPHSVKLLIDIIRGEVQGYKNTLSTCYRGAFLAGMFIIMKWIREDRLIDVDEYYFGRLAYEIELIISDNYY